LDAEREIGKKIVSKKNVFDLVEKEKDIRKKIKKEILIEVKNEK